MFLLKGVKKVGRVAVVLIFVLISAILLVACTCGVTEGERDYAVAQCAVIKQKLTEIEVAEIPESYTAEAGFLALASDGDWSKVNGEWIIKDPDNTIDPGNIYGWHDTTGGYYHTWSEEFYLSLSGEDVSQNHANTMTCEYMLDELKKFIEENNLGDDAEISDKITVLDASISALKEKISGLFALIENMSSILETIVAQNDELIDQNNTLIGQNEILISQNETLSEQFKIIIEQNTLLSKSIENLNLANSSLDTKVSELTTSNAQLAEVISTLTELMKEDSGSNTNTEVINALIQERDTLVEQINTLTQENSDLRAQIDAQSNPAREVDESDGLKNDYKLIDGKFAVRLGYWESGRAYIKSIAVAVYGDTQIYKVETLASTGIYVDASTCLVANKCYYSGSCIWTNEGESETIKVTTDSGVYIVKVALGKDYINNYDGMQYSWGTFTTFYNELND